MHIGKRSLFCVVLLWFSIEIAGPQRGFSQNSLAARLPLPNWITLCAPNCSKLYLSDGRYTVVSGPEANYAVQSFETESVAITRVDNGGGRAVVTGKMALEGDRLVHCQIHWISANWLKPNGPSSFACQMTWGKYWAEAKALNKELRNAPQLAPSREYFANGPTVGEGPTGTIVLDTKLAIRMGIAVSNTGEVFVADRGPADGTLPQTRRIMQVYLESGKTQLIADHSKPNTNNNPFRYSGPVSLAEDDLGNLYTLTGSGIARINVKTGSITVLTVRPANEAVVHRANGGVSVDADSRDHFVHAFDVDAKGNVYTGGDDGILKRDPAGKVTTLADLESLTSPESAPSWAILNPPPNITFMVDADGNVYFDSVPKSGGNGEIMKLSSETGKITKYFSQQNPEGIYCAMIAIDHAGNPICRIGPQILGVSNDSEFTVLGHASTEGIVAIDRSDNLYILATGANFAVSIEKLSAVVR